MNLHQNREREITTRHGSNEATLGGSFIDANGREVPITEEMIQSACLELEKRLVKSAQKN